MLYSVDNKYSTVSSATVKDYVLCILVIIYTQISIKFYFRFFFYYFGDLKKFFDGIGIIIWTSTVI